MATRDLTVKLVSDTLLPELKSMQTKLRSSLMVVCDTAAKQMEEYAKQNRKWKDRTSNARQLLKGEAYWENKDVIVAAVFHQVEYGIWLELAHGRKYAILEEAIKAKTPQLLSACERLLS